jgi:2-keto-3-deoxy-L-arabinonate dehydratase
MSDKLTGVFPVFQTPFHEDDSIDFATLEKEFEWLIDRGSNGIVMAMVSETLRLSSEERDELASRTCSIIDRRLPVVISVGAESTHTAIRHTRHAEESGAAAVMAIPPIATNLGEAGLRTYYQSLIAASTIPIIIQDASGYVGNSMSIELQAELLNEFGPERILFKPEANPVGPKLSALREATHGQARVFEGSGGMALLDTYRRGIVGTMPGAEIIDAQVAFWKALTDENTHRATQLSETIVSLVALQCHSLDGFLAVEKHLLVKQGIFTNSRIRGPISFELDRESVEEVDRRFDRLQETLHNGS